MGQTWDRHGTDTGQTKDRYRTDMGQTWLRQRTDTGQIQDRHMTKIHFTLVHLIHFAPQLHMRTVCVRHAVIGGSCVRYAVIGGSCELHSQWC